MAKRSCFVIMPIRKEGTPDYAHFRALYENMVKPVIETAGYEVRRADEIQESGAITKDIILRLVDADLVVADLTDLNPNVFYELGVRHSLRGFGTIMLLDTLRTENIPFDLSIYRVVRFEGKMEGIGRLRQELTAFMQLQKTDTGNARDNPVHDILPGLPLNAAESVNGIAEGRLRKEIDELRRRLKTYEIKYGLQEAHETSKMTPSDVVKAALAEVGAGHSPIEMVKLADAAADRRDIKAFLEVIQRVFDLKIIRLTPELYGTLVQLSERMGLGEITGAIFENALSIYPSNDVLRTTQLMHFAHSPLPPHRERARQELLRDIGILVTDTGEVTVPSNIDTEGAQKIGIMLDAYHADGLDAQALRITSALVERYGESTRVLRNHARALKRAGRDTDSITWYQKAIWCPDVDDTSVLWFGNQLHNLERHVDAVEVYLLACISDPDDASHFAHFADELVIVMRERGRPGKSARALPGEIETNATKLVREAIMASFSCRDFSEEDLRRCMGAGQQVEGINFEELLQARSSMTVTDGANSHLRTRAGRLSFARKLYDLMKSDLTQRK